MPRFVVLESDIETKDQKVKVMRDGFAILAIGFPIPWLLFHRLWLETAIVGVALFAVNMYSENLYLTGITFVGNLAIGLLVALEGDNRIIAKAKRRGYREVAIVADAENKWEAEWRAAYLLGQQQRKNKNPDREPNGDSDMILGLA
ncbi:MAG: DUF2628 domain-containing protein [Pseudomonadota bacterium]